MIYAAAVHCKREILFSLTSWGGGCLFYRFSNPLPSTGVFFDTGTFQCLEYPFLLNRHSTLRRDEAALPLAVKALGVRIVKK